MAYSLLLYSLYSYDTFDYIKLNFYDQFEFYKFKYHPYGELIDECKSKNTSETVLFDYFELNNKKKFWIDNLNNLLILNNSRISTTFKEFDLVADKIDKLLISEYIHTGINDEGDTAWDLENEEQINFFLFDLPEYKQMKIKRKKD